jgi:hypothetical protein
MSDATLSFGASDDGSLAAQFRRITAGLDSVSKSATDTTSRISGSFKALASVAVVATFTKLAHEAFEYAEAIAVAANKTGIAVDSIQELQFISKQADVSFDTVTSAINKFQKEIVEGGTETTKALKRIGVTVEEIRAQKPEDQFLRIAQGVASIENPAERTATAMALFGKSGAELLPLINEGPDGIRALGVSFDELGVKLDAKAIAKLNDAGDAVDRLLDSVKALGVELISVAATPIEKASDGLTLLIKSFRFLAKGGEGGDIVVDLSRQIDVLRSRAAAWQRDAQFSQEAVRQAAALNREADLLQQKLNRLTGFGIEGVAAAKPTITPNFDFSKFAIPNNVSKAIAASQPKVSTAQQLREQHIVDSQTPDQIATLEAEDLKKINQDKLNALLDQERQHVEQIKILDHGLARFRAGVRETFGLQEISFEEAKNSTILDLAGSVFGVLAKENSKIAKVQQALAIATIIYDTSRAVMRAYAELPYPANIAASLKAVALGAIQIAKVRATNYSASGTSGSVAGTGGGAAGGTASSANTATNTPTQKDLAAARTVTQVTINGIVTKEIVDQLLAGLKDQFRRGSVIIQAGTNQANEIRRSA